MVPAYIGKVHNIGFGNGAFMCKEKIEQEKKDENDIAKGIVKWLVQVSDETGEQVAVATILTMVAKKSNRVQPVFQIWYPVKKYDRYVHKNGPNSR